MMSKGMRQKSLMVALRGIRQRAFSVFLGVGCVFGVGCVSRPDPYSFVDNWLIRQNAVPPYFAEYDVFYAARELYEPVDYPVDLYDYAYAQTVEMFGKKVRIFAPLIHDAGDVEAAVEHYLGHYHRGKRHFVFLGEGKGGELLKAYAEENAGALKRRGMVAGWYSPGSEGMVTSNLVEEVGRAVKFARYEQEWGRERKGEGK